MATFIDINLSHDYGVPGMRRGVRRLPEKKAAEPSAAEKWFAEHPTVEELRKHLPPNAMIARKTKTAIERYGGRHTLVTRSEYNAAVAKAMAARRSGG